MTDTNQRGYKVSIIGEYPEPTDRDAPVTINVQVFHPLTGDVWRGKLEWDGVDENLQEEAKR